MSAHDFLQNCRSRRDRIGRNAAQWILPRSSAPTRRGANSADRDRLRSCAHCLGSEELAEEHLSQTRRVLSKATNEGQVNSPTWPQSYIAQFRTLVAGDRSQHDGGAHRTRMRTGTAGTSQTSSAI